MGNSQQVKDSPFDAGARQEEWSDARRSSFDLFEPVPDGVGSFFWELRRTIRSFLWDNVHGMKRYQRYLMGQDSGATLGLRQPMERWPAGTQPSAMRGPQTFVFYGIERTLPDSRAWRHLPWGDQWLVQLHRFDYLDVIEADRQQHWHRALISKWMLANRPGRGPGWTSPCLAPRIINWIKWDLRYGCLSSEEAVRSLTVQVRYLRQFYARHRDNGSPVEVAKAMVFAGCFFADTAESRSWLRKGLRELERIAPRQVSEADMNDLAWLAKVYPSVLPPYALRRWCGHAFAAHGSI